MRTPLPGGLLPTQVFTTAIYFRSAVAIYGIISAAYNSSESAMPLSCLI